jgi:nitroimidazol reductase NimA-like FMN-containing flavoprotein (pyridoxamine 5'-phosphate oxidase superfamily)
MTSRGFDQLRSDECLDLLSRNSFGRVGMRIAEDPVVLPVYYALIDGEIVFHTDPGTKLIAAVLESRVAFEIDDREDGWSVLVVGRAHEVRSPTPEMIDLQAGLEAHWPDGERDRVVRIEIERVTGRRLRRSP